MLSAAHDVYMRTLPDGGRARAVRCECRVADPARHPVDGVLSLTNPVGSAVDKVRVGALRVKSLLGSLEDIYRAPETTTQRKLEVRRGPLQTSGPQRSSARKPLA